MRTASAKAKGRRACLETKALILKAYPGLSEDDVQVTSSGATGEDLKLSPLAREIFPFAFEIKNQERINIWEAIDQSEKHAEGTGYRPIVVFRRNGGRLRAVVDAEYLLTMVANVRIQSLIEDDDDATLQ